LRGCLTSEGDIKELIDVIVAAFQPVVREDNERVHTIGTVIDRQFDAGQQTDAIFACAFSQRF
jgi:hypothetical protein